MVHRRFVYSNAIIIHIGNNSVQRRSKSCQNHSPKLLWSWI